MLDKVLESKTAVFLILLSMVIILAIGGSCAAPGEYPNQNKGNAVGTYDTIIDGDLPIGIHKIEDRRHCNLIYVGVDYDGRYGIAVVELEDCK